MPATILCIGDLHLGKAPGSLSAVAAERFAADMTSIGPECAWERAVDAAIEHEVDAVLLAGDVVHDLDDAFRVERLIEDGVKRLASERIPVFAVMGNHDARALPAVARSIEGLQLLGENATWQCATLRRRADNTPFANLFGWSFPDEHHRNDPLLGFEQCRGDVDPALPGIGLLHADLNATESDYAPVSRTGLEAKQAVDAWLLGHIHTTSHAPMQTERPIGYLGSVTALKRSDCGEHGVWLLRLADTRVTMELLPIAPLRFDFIDVDVSDCGNVEGVDLRSAIESHLRSIDCASIGAFGARLRLVGKVEDPRVFNSHDWSSALEASGNLSGTEWFVCEIESTVARATNLQELASASGAASLLAQDILTLESKSDGWEALLAFARDEIGGQNEITLTALANAGRRALDELLATGDSNNAD